MTGLFKASQSGNHIFKVNCKPCQIKLMISNVANSVDPSKLQTLIDLKHDGYYDFRDFDADSSLTANAVSMEKDKYYLVRVYFLVKSHSNTYMSVSA